MYLNEVTHTYLALIFRQIENHQIYIQGILQFSCSVVSDSLWSHELQHARPPCPSLTPRVYPNSCPLSHWCHLTILFPSHLSSPSPPAFNLSQHQGLFKWVSSSHQVTKILEFQLQHQSFQGILFSHKKQNKVMPFAATWTELEIIIQSKVCQRRRQIPYSIIYMCNLKHDANELIYKTETDLQKENGLWLPRGRRDGGGIKWVSGISRFKIVYREWIDKNYCGAGNDMKYFVTNHNGKENEKACMHVCNRIALLNSRN